VKRFKNTERWARTDQVLSSLGLMVELVWVLLSLDPSGSDLPGPPGSGSTP